MRDELRAAVPSVILFLVCGCPRGDGPPARGQPFRYPPRADRLDRETEGAIVTLLDNLCGREYLVRIRAEDDLRRRLEKAPTDERAKISGYVVRLLDEPQVDVRASALRLLMRHGRDCPEAVAALVQVLGDEHVASPVRDGAARALARWTGKDLGYRAYDPVLRVRAAAARWREWIEETGGRLPPREPAP